MVLRKIWRCMSTCKPMYKESESWRYPMVQLSGIKTQGAAGNRLFMKKLKLGLPKLG
ncbi:hypothetical protein GQ55_8G221100 [Panicum hallii var. hallii]|uniref:Uncharacterized protein n=1 Tax=Panicum hallii var. hallii TaxID=1504633 RepID=A0A2T7CQ09_9POAL|nr:hypothetical protein GQ55_8G221100 [Panicum hallii var. hallii]